MNARSCTRLAASFALLLTVGALSAPPSSGALPRTYQVQRVDSSAPTANGRFGLALVNVGDVDGDGKPDLLTGTDKHGTVQGVNQVTVVSGATGAILRTYAVPDLDADAGGSDRATGFGNAVTRMGDIGRCSTSPGAGVACPAGQYSAVVDGIAEHAVAASGVDVDANGDDLGVVYVFDGATGALLERLRMPLAERNLQRVTFNNTDPRYGRTLLSPGDVVLGDGRPDLLVGATDFSENKADAHPASQCAQQVGTAPCTGAGRVFAYSGAAMDGNPSTVLETAGQTIKSPMSQPDDNGAYPPGPFNPPEGFGILLIPVGAAGSCTSGVPAAGPGAACTAPSNNTTTAGDPAENDFAIVANGFDVLGINEVGRVVEIDGKTLANLKGTDYPDPRPEASWGQAQNGTVYPALGDLAGSTHPDFIVPDIQWSGTHEAEGRVLTVNGQPSSQGSFREYPSRFLDPTPQTGEQFGLSATTVGDVAGDPHNELLIGAIGPHNPGTNPNVVNDVHIYDPITEEAVQTIGAPDAQGGESFGISVAALGDLNGDSFQDFAVGAGFYDLTNAATGCSPCTNAGRIYIFRSDNSPGPPPPPLPAGPPGPSGTPGRQGHPGPPGAAAVLAGRTLELEASRNRVRRRGRVTLRGLLEAFADERSCQTGQSVALQRRRPGRLPYRTFRRVRSSRSGAFSTRIRPTRTYIYRARVPRTPACTGAASPRERVTVVSRRRR